MARSMQDCDILVVGGGIHGVGVAQAAAAAGYRAVLLEQRRLAAGTSSRSSKLIHGGLRYLESGQFRLVRESLRERELLLRLAPGLVHRQPFYIPVYPHMSRPRWKLTIGLTLYWLLGGMESELRFGSVRRQDWDELDGLTTDKLRAVLRYVDAQTDDRALTEAVMRSAESLGVTCICPAVFKGARGDGNGYDVVYMLDGREETCRALVLVNAAGPWANEVLSKVIPLPPPMPVELVQGTHLELPGVLSAGCYYLEVPADRRAVFVMPWKGRTLLGTTEHRYDGDPARVSPLDQEIEYLLKVYARFFPNRSRDVLDAWAGLRVLPSGGKAFSRSRETQLPTDDPRRPRLISIFGGKLTGYRATAQTVIRRITPSLPQRQKVADTAALPLSAE